jgi:hypothetical protein
MKKTLESGVKIELFFCDFVIQIVKPANLTTF